MGAALWLLPVHLAYYLPTLLAMLIYGFLTAGPSSFHDFKDVKI